MVDFNKRLAGKKVEKPTDAVKLYETLDRARDIIVKLHTGQGKTLIGLPMLSRGSMVERDLPFSCAPTIS